MTMKLGKLALAFASAAMLTVAGCGGGGGGGTAPASAALEGTAATGAAMANAGVVITNSGGNSPCQEASITTSALGSYSCTMKAGETAPFFVVVTDPTGNTPPLVSVSTSTPAAGAKLTINATPLTTAIVAQLNNGDALGLVKSGKVDAAALKKVTDNVVTQLAGVLASINAPAGYDPFTTSITAATAAGTGNTADMVLDIVKIVTNPATGKLALTTVDNPNPVDLASATTAGAALPAPAAGVSDLSQAAQIAAKTFNECFAVPTAQRVLTKDTAIPQSQGGPEVDEVAAACQNIVANAANAAAMKFLHNGYNAGQFFYGMLTNNAMTGAKFSVPEIMAFYPAANTASGKDEAVLNLKFIDANGDPDNVIVVARNIANTSSTARPTNWWLVGNQHPADVVLRLNIRRVEQMNAANTATNKISTFQSGLQITVNAKGPGSINAGNTMTFARISGPGLPGNGAAGTGVVYVRSTGPQNSMDIYSKNGNLTGGAQCGNGVTFNCPNIWLSRTKGITGTDATQLTTNPPITVWAQAAEGFDPTKIVKGAKYKVELFYGSDITTPVHVFKKTVLTDLIQATAGVNLPWNTPGAQTKSALDPNGSLTGAQTALPVDWLQNPAAQQIGGVQAIVDTTNGSYAPMQRVPKGATSIILNSQTVPVLDTNANIGRTLLFNYRMIDSSNKSAVYTYN